MPIVSIIIPTYNRTAYLPQAIQSIKQQTIEDWELIIVDDGSTMDVRKVIQTHMSDSRISLIRQEKTGVSAARNRGVKEARSNFIAFLDDDDYWHPEKLEMHLNAFDSTPELSLTFSDAQMVDEAGNPTRRFQKSKNTIYTCSWFDSYEGLNIIPVGLSIETILNGIVLPSATVMKKSAFEKIGGFDIDLKGGEDMELIFRLTRTEKIGYIDRPLIDYKLTSESASRNRLAALIDADFMVKKLRNTANCMDIEVLDKRQRDIRLNLAYLYFHKGELNQTRKWSKGALELGWNNKAVYFNLLSRLPDFILNYLFLIKKKIK